MHDPGERLLRERSATARWLALTIAGEPCGTEDPTAVRRPDGKDDRDRLEAERVRLFVNAPGGVPAPPYASWWMESTLAGETSREVERFYGEEGLRGEPGAGPPDYLPALLEFLHFLLQHQVAARRTGQNVLERSGRAREREFLERFLTPWLPAFCAAAMQATREPFWRQSLALLEAFAAAEAERLAGNGTGS